MDSHHNLRAAAFVPAFVPALPVSVCAAPPAIGRQSTSTKPTTCPIHLHRSPTTATIATPSPSAPTPANSPDGADLPNLITIRSPEQFDILAAHAHTNGTLICLDFMAMWCRKCKYLVPRIRKLAALYPATIFCIVDVNAVRRLPKQFNITKMPTFVFLQHGKVQHTLIGGAAPQQVAKQLDSLIYKFNSP